MTHIKMKINKDSSRFLEEEFWDKKYLEEMDSKA